MPKGAGALGRLGEVAGPLTAGLKMRIEQQDWENAAIVAGNLSELRLTIGELRQAVMDGRQAVALADQIEDEFLRMAMRITLADALWQAGKVAEAEGLFREAADLQGNLELTYPRLYSIQGYQFCAQLLAKGEWKKVKDQAQYALVISQRNRWLLAIALTQLSIGRASHLHSLAEGAGDFGEAQDWLDQAVESLRKAGENHHLPRGLLVRAALLRDMCEFADAEKALQEVEEIASSGEMRLHLCDYHLEMARLCRVVGGRAGEAAGHYQEARRLVEETGYHRRDGELAELRVALGLG